ncbi:MAG: Rpn family recombination-promoting nuclease/putative transposase [Chitinophagaceae bacterium]
MKKITPFEMEKHPKRILKIGEFIDPMTDFGFKRLFGSESNKELLIDFLNELLHGRKAITDLHYNKNEFPGSRPTERKVIFDLTCTGTDGEQFIIEVQRIKQEYFRDRAIYYTSRLLHDQGLNGETWDYSLKEVFFIGLMDFMFSDSDRDHYLHYRRLAYEDGRFFYKKLEFIFLEIPKFVKTLQELETNMDKWVYALKNLYLL